MAEDEKPVEEEPVEEEPDEDEEQAWGRHRKRFSELIDERLEEYHKRHQTPKSEDKPKDGEREREATGSTRKRDPYERWFGSRRS